RVQQAPRVGRAGSSGDAEEDAHALQSTPASYFGPFEASRKLASSVSRASPSPANEGIGEPGLTAAGFIRWRIWNSMPLFFAPSAIATGRRDGRRSLRVSMNGTASRRTRQMVGMPIVPRTTVAGHLKIRSR